MSKFQAQHQQGLWQWPGRRLTSADLRAGNPSLTITVMAERFAALHAYATPSLS